MHINQSISVLLVENDEMLSIVTKESLLKFGYSVFTTNTAAAAIQQIKTNKAISIVLMDIDLGSEMDGIEAANIILSEKDVPLIELLQNSILATPIWKRFKKQRLSLAMVIYLKILLRSF